MIRAVNELAILPDDRLFKEVSEGIPLIVQNAIRLNEAAEQLHKDAQFHVSEIIRGFAEEEAAKVLILIDLIRCPLSNQGRKVETAKRFYGHVAKRIYATICSYPRIASFEELSEFVEKESRPCYLDGPNKVDWIFPNSIIMEREQALYVDYVQNIADKSGDCFWSDPGMIPENTFEYVTPDCIKLSCAISEFGAASPEGLGVIAEIWRIFEPVPGTDREELRKLIKRTLARMTNFGTGIENKPILNFIVSHWSFPLWSLTIKEPRATNKVIEELHQVRACTIEWIQKTDAKRNPPPAISRSKVEALGDAYAEWQHDVDVQNVDRVEGEETRSTFRKASVITSGVELPSYKRIDQMLRNLTEAERAALLALAWYAQERGVADWSNIYDHAISMVARLDNGYQIFGNGHYWLNGLERWEADPQAFNAGRRYHV